MDRDPFHDAIVVFIGGSLLCAVSNSLPAFVISRFLQGMGGAMMVPVGRLVIMRAVPKRDYVAALNYLTIPALMGPVIGPALGGAITLFFHWRWIFIINLPIGLLGLVLVHRFIPNLREPAYRRSIGAVSLIRRRPVCADARVVGVGRSSTADMGNGCVHRRWYSRFVAYVLHARRTEHPSLDLRLFRSSTFFNGVAAGSIFRIGVGATPFLLPLLLQLGFGLNPLQSGLLTCATAIGAMFMKTLTVMILKRWGFRTVLTINALLTGISVAICAFFNSMTPHVVIVLVLLVSGCLRSLQFTGLQALSFADTTREDMSQATSIASMTQRLAQSLGIAIGAYALELSSLAQGHSSIVAADFPPAFIAIGVLAALSALFHRRLTRSAGTEVSGHSLE